MNLEVLNKYYEDGLLQKQTHPSLPLTIWNYTPKVQYENLWDEITLSCRGLVTGDSGEIVARPFKKFFNIEEAKYTPTSDFEVYEKMDGSLGILFNYAGEWILATRGSFTSDQSIKGRELIEKYDYKRLDKSYTYLFEIIYPENRIVCTYDFEDLVLLGMIKTASGNEANIHPGNGDVRIYNLLSNIGLNIVKKYDGIEDYHSLKGIISDTNEGFVIRFSNGDRIKIKGEEYLRLHKIMTNLSTTAVWETLSNSGNIEDILVDVPDEFYERIKEYSDSLKKSFSMLDNDYKMIFKAIKNKEAEGSWNRGVFAAYATMYKHPSILFHMLDNRDYSHVIWKLLKPEFRKL